MSVLLRRRKRIINLGPIMDYLNDNGYTCKFDEIDYGTFEDKDGNRLMLTYHWKQNPDFLEDLKLGSRYLDVK